MDKTWIEMGKAEIKIDKTDIEMGKKDMEMVKKDMEMGQTEIDWNLNILRSEKKICSVYQDNNNVRFGKTMTFWEVI